MKTSPLSDAEIARRLERDLPGWRHVDGAIRRRYRTGGWKSGLSLVAAIGALAEAADHHPDLLLRYADLEARLATHDAGGVSSDPTVGIFSLHPGGANAGKADGSVDFLSSDVEETAVGALCTRAADDNAATTVSL